MMAKIFTMFKDIFSYCIGWTTDLLDTMGASEYVLAGFILSVIVVLFLVPLRGGAGGIDTTSVGDLVRQATYKPKHWNGQKVKSNPQYKGKFETRKQGGHRASPR